MDSTPLRVARGPIACRLAATAKAPGAESTQLRARGESRSDGRAPTTKEEAARTREDREGGRTREEASVAAGLVWSASADRRLALDCAVDDIFEANSRHNKEV